MLTNTNAIVADWQNEKNNFINSSGNSATSSLNKLTNDFVYYYEKGFRANKIGIPVESGMLGKLMNMVLKDITEEIYLSALLKKH